MHCWGMGSRQHCCSCWGQFCSQAGIGCTLAPGWRSIQVQRPKCCRHLRAGLGATQRCGWPVLCGLPQGKVWFPHPCPCCALCLARLWEAQEEGTVVEAAAGQDGVRSVGSLTVVPSAAFHPCSRLRPRLCFSGKGAARGRQCLTAPCFWQVPTSSTSASSCWSARIRPRPGLFPAACPRSPVSPPWPRAASSSWGSSRSRMRVKKPCQVSSPGSTAPA